VQHSGHAFTKLPYTLNRPKNATAQRWVLLCASLAAALSLSGCGAGHTATQTKTQTQSPIALSVSPVSTAVAPGSTEQYDATVTGSANTAVTWLVNSIPGGNSTTGTISSSGLFTAPANPPTDLSETITATSVADPSKSVSVQVSVTRSTTPKVSVSVSPASAQMRADGSTQFTATVSGVSNTGVMWSVNDIKGGDSTVGTISTGGLYSAPASLSSTLKVTVKATSDRDLAKSATASVTVISSSNTGADYYVAPNGSDSNSGSASSPWATISHADSVAQPGWTIHVLPGTYTISGGSGVGMTLASSGTASSRIVYISDTLYAAHIVINGGNDSSDPNVGIQTTGSWIDIVGFDITEGANGKYRAALVNTSGSNVRFISNRVHDLQHSAVISGCTSWGGYGIGSFQGTGETDILGNYIYNIGDVTDTSCVFSHGVYMNSPGLIQNNIIFHNVGMGLNINQSNVTITNNRIFNQGAGGIFIDDNGGTWSGHHVNNNIIYNVGIGSSHQNGISYYYTNDSSSDSSFTDNIVYQSSGTQGNNWNSNGSVSYTGYINSNPAFVNYTGDQNGDYHLTSTSPAVDKGTSSDAPAIDFSGGSRPQGAGYDLGAYEYGATAATWPWQQ
jgi:hypothetical protein